MYLLLSKLQFSPLASAELQPQILIDLNYRIKFRKEARSFPFLTQIWVSFPILPVKTGLQRVPGSGHVGPRVGGAPECFRGDPQRDGGQRVPVVGRTTADAAAASRHRQQHAQAARRVRRKSGLLLHLPSF